MYGPTLTPREAVATVARRVRRLESQGLDRDHAIQRAAVELGLEPRKVRWSAETATPDSTVPVPSPRRQRGCPGCSGRMATVT